MRWQEKLLQAIPPVLRTFRTSPTEIARTLLVVMGHGSLSTAEGITGHKYETIGRWLRVASQAEAITNALVHDLHLTAVEVDAFWSFVKKASLFWMFIRHTKRVGTRKGRMGRWAFHGSVMEGRFTAVSFGESTVTGS